MYFFSTSAILIQNLITLRCYSFTSPATLSDYVPVLSLNSAPKNTFPYQWPCLFCLVFLERYVILKKGLHKYFRHFLFKNTVFFPEKGRFQNHCPERKTLILETSCLYWKPPAYAGLREGFRRGRMEVMEIYIGDFV